MLTYGSTRQPFHVLPAAAEIEGHGGGWSMTSRQLPLQSLSEGPAKGASLPLCLDSLHAGAGLCGSGLPLAALQRAVSFLIPVR